MGIFIKTYMICASRMYSSVSMTFVYNSVSNSHCALTCTRFQFSINCSVKFISSYYWHNRFLSQHNYWDHSRMRSFEGGKSLLKSEEKRTRKEGLMLIWTLPPKEIIKENFYPSWNHWLHPRKSCLGNQRSMRRIKVVDSSKLAVAKFLIYVFIWGSFTVIFIS